MCYKITLSDKGITHKSINTSVVYTKFTIYMLYHLFYLPVYHFVFSTLDVLSLYIMISKRHLYISLYTSTLYFNVYQCNSSEMNENTI